MDKTALVPIAQGTEEMEAVIVIDMLRRANIKVVVVGENDIVTCSRAVKILPDKLFKDLNEHQLYDAVILPGGLEGTENLSKNHLLEEILDNHLKNNRLIAAICAAPTILVQHKILPENAVVTSHPSMSNNFQNFEYRTERVVRYNNFITSRGAGTAFDFSLRIIEVLVGKEIADKIARDIIYYE